MLVANAEADELIMTIVTSIAKRDYRIDYLKKCDLCDRGEVDYEICNRCDGTDRIVSGSLANNRRNDKKGLQAKMSKLGKVENVDYRLELETTYGDIDLAIFLMEKELRKIYYVTKCDRVDLYLGPTDGSNFRFTSAVTQPYKSGRPPKPPIIEQLREYLINVKGATILYGYEADDALGIFQTDDTIAVHYDKDIFMIPGLHYDTLRNKFVEVDELGSLEITTKYDKSGRKTQDVKGTGLAFFYYQLIVGDRTDTIPSMKSGFGAVKAYKALEHCTDEQAYMEAVLTLYHTSIGDGWVARLLEQADLVWICRNKEEKGSDYILRRYREIFGREL